MARSVDDVLADVIQGVLRTYSTKDDLDIGIMIGLSLKDSIKKNERNMASSEEFLRGVQLGLQE